MKFREALYNHFTFNRAEQRGVVILLVVLAGIIGFRIYLPDHPAYEKNGNSEFLEEVRKFEEEMAKVKHREKRNREVQPFTHQRSLPWGDSVKGSRQSHKPGFIIELNGADTLELQRLRGIGPAFARRIVGYRDRLGGFIRTDQLMEVFGMDRERFEGIKSNIAIDTSRVRKIDINQVMFKELMRHPYFPYELTREIIVCRKRIKKFVRMEQLKEIPGISDSVYMKISSYIDIMK